MRPRKRKFQYPHKPKPKPSMVNSIPSRDKGKREPRSVYQMISREEADRCLWSLAHVLVSNSAPRQQLIEAIPGITDPIPDRGPVAEKLNQLERLIERVHQRRTVANDQLWYLHDILSI